MYTKAKILCLAMLTATAIACDDGSSSDGGGTTGGSSGGDDDTTTANPSTTTSASGSTSGGEESSTGGSEDGESEGSESTGEPPHECEIGDGECVDEATERTCEEVDGVRVWVENACEEESVCTAGGCASPVQQEFIEQIATYINGVREGSALPEEPDWDALLADASAMVVAGDDSPETLFRAARAVQLRLPQGHNWLRPNPNECFETSGYAFSAQTFYATCGRISGDGVIVTFTTDDNPMGLAEGDRIVASNRWEEGPAFLDQLAMEPICDTTTPTTPDGIRRRAASNMFGILQEGDTLTVVNPAGETREVEVPARLEDDPVTWCTNPLTGGFSTFETALTMRMDGVAVIRVPHFGPSENPFPNPLTTEAYLQWVSDYVDRLALVLDQVPDDAPIVWDARSNTGGSAEVPMAIVAGMPGAQRMQISEGYQRIEGSDPFDYFEDPLPNFSFVIPEDDRLLHNAPVAVLTDMGTFSAADMFAWAASNFSDAIIVGTPAGAGYGFGGFSGVLVEGSVADIAYRIDPLQSRMMDGTVLEGVEVTPDIIVEYDPEDLAADVDTVLEAAVDALLE